MPPSAQPLQGRRIAVTRTREQASEFARILSALGAEVIELPVLRISKEIALQELADIMLELGSYDWIVFTSANGVRYFFEEFFRIFEDIRSLGLLRMACVGDGTSKVLAGLHLKVECRPAVATAEALADAMIDTGSLASAKVLVITGNLNRDTLIKKLEAAEAIVDRLQVYKTEETDLSKHPGAADFRERGADAVLFASGSSARFYGKHAAALKLAAKAKKPLNGSIGPQTSVAMKESGISVDFEASSPGLDQLVDALVKRLAHE